MTTSDLARPTYPEADRLDIVDRLHGVDVADPYRWLEDADDPRTKAWSAAQDDVYASVRETWPGRVEFHARLTELHAVGEVHVPTWRKDLAFALRRSPDQDHAVLSVTGPDGVSRVLVDPIAIDPSGSTTLDFWVPSPDGSRLAYGLSEGGTEAAMLRVMDVATGDVIDGPVDRMRYTPVAWLPGGDAFYYVRHLTDEAAPDGDGYLHRRVYKHTIGRDPENDPVVFGADAPRTTFFDVTISDDGRWLVVCPARGTDARNDVWIANVRDGGAFMPVQVGIDAVTETRFGRDGTLYLMTKRDAPRYRLCAAQPSELYEAGARAMAEGAADPGTATWREVIAEDPSAIIVDYGILDGSELGSPQVAVVRARHAIAEVTIHDLATGAQTAAVTLPGLGTVDELSARHDGGYEAWLTYTDLTTPALVLRYDAVAGAVDAWAEPPGSAATRVPVVTRHVTYPSYDGTEVGLFVASSVVAGSATPADGPVPTVLYGYGGFNISRPPTYDPWILAWIEAGGVFALASLRGGGEEGEAWHRDGMREHKQNVFDDFHAAGDWLVAQGITTYEQLGIFGGSNGGLLVGAALTQHPEKYAAVVCSAPLLDMVRYEQFGLGALWHGEFGTASEPTEFGWLYAYSPYHHVTEGVDYPAVTFTVFDGDSRVDPLHARKLCAALQHATSGSGPIVIRREQNVGHAGRAVSRTVDLAADRLAFFTAQLG